MTGLEIHADLAGTTVLVGILQVTPTSGSELSSFTYAPGWLEHPDGYALEPRLPLSAGTQSFGPLLGALRDASPDAWGERLLDHTWTVDAPRHPPLIRALVAVHDRHRQGALRLRWPGEQNAFIGEAAVSAGLEDLPALLAAADAVAPVERGTGWRAAEEAQLLVAAGAASLGGMRPKVPVVLPDGRSAIAKLPATSDPWDVLAGEYLAMTLAARCGIHTARTELLDLDGRSVLLVTRFDRTADGGRIGYLSAKSLLGLQPGEPSSYDEIARAIGDHGAAARADRLELFDRMVLNVAVGNTDDHLRNHGFLAGPGGWRLSPAFDITINPHDHPRSTFISGRGAEGDALGLGEAARWFPVPQAHVRAGMLEIAQVVAGWREVAEELGITRRISLEVAAALDWRSRLLREAAT
jgi:serine/threonine-protein kinase HipA